MKYDFEMDLDESTSVGKIAAQIKPDSRILEFGPGNGRMTKHLMGAKNCDVSIVELDKELYRYVKQFASDAFYGNIEEYLWVDYFEGQVFDYIIFADVLEHLMDPQKTLEIVKQFLAEDGEILITFPNLAHNSVLINLFNNKLEWTEYGLLDATHKTFFTQSGFQKVFTEVGLWINIEDFTINQVGNNEIAALYSDLPIETQFAFKNRPFGEVYQYFYSLKSQPVTSPKLVIPDNSNYWKNVRLVFDYGDRQEERTYQVNTFTGENKAYFVDVPLGIKELTIYPTHPHLGGIVRFFVEIGGEPYGTVAGNAVFSQDEKYIFTNLETPYFTLFGDEIGGEQLALNLDYIFEGQYLHEMNQLMSYVSSFENQRQLIIDRYHNVVTGKIEKFGEVSLKELHRLLSFSIDKISYDETSNETIISGWAFTNSNHEEVTLSIPENQSPFYTVERVKRLDVNDAFGFSEELTCGFVLKMTDYLWSDKVALNIATKEGDKVSVTLDRRTGLAVSKNPFSRLRRIAGTVKRKGVTESVKWVLNRNKQKNLYQNWIHEHENFDLEAIKKEIEQFAYQPKISVAVPVYNVEEKWLDACVDSLKNQTYQNWELCIADDASPKAHIRPLLERYMADDDRIKVVFREKNGHISEATNSAIAIATGDYLGFMDNDDELAPHALFEIVKALNNEPDIDFFYTDEDKITVEEERFDGFFKPNWNAELILGHNYITHFVVVKKELLAEVGGLRTEFNGSQDYDFVLRATEKAKKIHHVPGIMYHWRAIESSTALNPESKGYAYIAGQHTLEAALERRGEKGTVEIAEFYGCYKINYQFDREPKVSILIHGQTKNISETVNTILSKTYYADYEVILSAKEKNHFSSTDPRIRFLEGSLNDQVALCSGEYIVLLNADITPKTGNWLHELMNFGQKNTVGVVTGRISDSKKQIANIGCSIDTIKKEIIFPELGAPEQNLGYYYRIALPRCVQAATEDCLLFKKSDFEDFGLQIGVDLDSQIKGIDFSLQILNVVGKEVVYTPYAKFEELSTMDRKISTQSIEQLTSKWQGAAQDPYANPYSL